MRAPVIGSIIEASITGGLAVCHEWWFKRQSEEAEATRRIWDEFDRTRPPSDPEVTEEELEITLRKPEAERLVVKD